MQGRCDVTDEDFLSALDLLDSLVDGNVDTVTKQRVTIWKQMMRDRIATDRSKLERRQPACPLDHHMCPWAWTKEGG
jgi:hypothetical protein